MREVEQARNALATAKLQQEEKERQALNALATAKLQQEEKERQARNALATAKLQQEKKAKQAVKLAELEAEEAQIALEMFRLQNV